MAELNYASIMPVEVKEQDSDSVSSNSRLLFQGHNGELLLNPLSIDYSEES